MKTGIRVAALPAGSSSNTRYCYSVWKVFSRTGIHRKGPYDAGSGLYFHSNDHHYTWSCCWSKGQAYFR